jgi:hypothetical protein
MTELVSTDTVYGFLLTDGTILSMEKVRSYYKENDGVKSGNGGTNACN